MLILFRHLPFFFKLFTFSPLLLNAFPLRFLNPSPETLFSHQIRNGSTYMSRGGPQRGLCSMSVVKVCCGRGRMLVVPNLDWQLQSPFMALELYITQLGIYKQ